MKIDAETLKKQVILHLPYILFLLVLPSWARRCVWLPEQTLPKSC